MEVKKCLVIAGSRGIGRGIAQSLQEKDYDVNALSRKDLDTSNAESVDAFLEKSESYDVLVLNTGGPPAKKFEEITSADCEKYHQQLFYGFFKILQDVQINNDGYIFLISSFNVKEPNPELILSNAYRLAFISAFKSLSKTYAKRNITTINIAPGPIDTDRLRELNSDLERVAQNIPLGRIGQPCEIGNFVSAIVSNEIKYLTGVTINFDGGQSSYVL